MSLPGRRRVQACTGEAGERPVYGRGRPNACQAGGLGWEAAGGVWPVGQGGRAGVGREPEVRPPPGAASRQQGELGVQLIRLCRQPLPRAAQALLLWPLRQRCPVEPVSLFGQQSPLGMTTGEAEKGPEGTLGLDPEPPWTQLGGAGTQPLARRPGRWGAPVRGWSMGSPNPHHRCTKPVRGQWGEVRPSGCRVLQA